MNLIWPFFKGQYKVHCRTGEIARQIASWSGCIRDSVYYYPDGHIEYDVIIPKKHLDRAKRILACERSESESGDNTTTDNSNSPSLNDNDLQEAKIEYPDAVGSK